MVQLRTVGAAEAVPVEGNGDPAGAYGDLIDGAAVLNGILEPGIVGFQHGKRQNVLMIDRQVREVEDEGQKIVDVLGRVKDAIEDDRKIVEDFFDPAVGIIREQFGNERLFPETKDQGVGEIVGDLPVQIERRFQSVV